MKWITRQSIRVNRTATCWLIKRFLDEEPEFLFVPAEQVASIQDEIGAAGFGAPGATYPDKRYEGAYAPSQRLSKRGSRTFRR
jgi:hypothetical protein